MITLSKSNAKRMQSVNNRLDRLTRSAKSEARTHSYRIDDTINCRFCWGELFATLFGQPLPKCIINFGEIYQICARVIPSSDQALPQIIVVAYMCDPRFLNQPTNRTEVELSSSLSGFYLDKLLTRVILLKFNMVKIYQHRQQMLKIWRSWAERWLEARIGFRIQESDAIVSAEALIIHKYNFWFITLGISFVRKESIEIAFQC